MKKTLLAGLVCVLALGGCGLFEKEQPKPVTIDLSEAAKDLPIGEFVPPVKINVPQPNSDGEFTNMEDFAIDKVLNMPIPKDGETVNLPKITIPKFDDKGNLINAEEFMNK